MLVICFIYLQPFRKRMVQKRHTEETEKTRTYAASFQYSLPGLHSSHTQFSLESIYIILDIQICLIDFHSTVSPFIIIPITVCMGMTSPKLEDIFSECGLSFRLAGRRMDYNHICFQCVR